MLASSCLSARGNERFPSEHNCRSALIAPCAGQPVFVVRRHFLRPHFLFNSVLSFGSPPPKYIRELLDLSLPETSY